MSVIRHSGQLFHTPEEDDLVKRYNHAMAVVKSHFPSAISSSDVLAKVNSLLHIKKGDKSYFYAQSVCADEINFERKDITRLFSDHIGEVFQLGGLGGIPFTGKTGFAAYSSHIPDIPADGNLFILVASHVGVSNDGELGKVDRKGKTHADSTCGAACGALKQCLECNTVSAPAAVRGDMSDDYAMDYQMDYQMDYIKSQIHKHLVKITSQSDPQARQATLAVVMYNIAKDCLNRIIHFNRPTPPTVYLLGGIQINMPHASHSEDLFVPLLFEKRDGHGIVSNLLMDAFGKEADRQAQLHNWAEVRVNREDKKDYVERKAVGFVRVAAGGVYVASCLYALYVHYQQAK